MANTSRSCEKVIECMINEELMSLPSQVIRLFILLSGVIGNSLVITAHWKDPLRVFKNTSSLFVLNIAISDIFVAFWWILRIAFVLISEKTSSTLLVIWIGFTTFSPWTFLCLAIERFLSVAFPLWHRIRVTTQTCHKVIIGTWIVHTAIYILAQLIFNAVFGENFIFCYGIVVFFCIYVVYFATYIALRRQRKEFEKRQDISESALKAMKVRQKHEKRFLVTIAIVCFMLTIIFLPVIGMRTIIVLLENVLEKKTVQDMTDGFQIVLSINFFMNPIIYLLRLPKYKKTFKVLYCNFTK